MIPKLSVRPEFLWWRRVFVRVVDLRLSDPDMGDGENIISNDLLRGGQWCWCVQREVLSLYVGCVFMSSSSIREEEDPGDCDVEKIKTTTITVRVKHNNNTMTILWSYVFVLWLQLLFVVVVVIIRGGCEVIHIYNKI